MGDEGGRLEQAREESIRRLKAGTLPVLAEQRLQELRGRPGFFTSDLSVSEFAVSKDTGLRPVSQVMGSSVYHAYYATSKSWNGARATALRRLALEAKACGADTVVGVHITYGDREFASSSVEFVALGTAVSRGRKVPQEPVLTALSAQDYWRLVRRGYEALGVVASTSIAACLPSVATQRGQRFGVLAASGRQNREVEEFSRSVRLAYAQARSDLQAQAQAFRAEGIVGVRLEREQRGIEDRGGKSEIVTVIVHAIGTAVARSRSAHANAGRLAIMPVRHLD
jgi:uncharacterized protein YbjQ (UPF0145 family)